MKKSRKEQRGRWRNANNKKWPTTLGTRAHTLFEEHYTKTIANKIGSVNRIIINNKKEDGILQICTAS